MFPGEGAAGCGCSCGTPPCTTTCAICGDGVSMEQAPGCVRSACSKFYLEVSNFGNNTTAPNAQGCNGTGTQCSAYNGTFVLKKQLTCAGEAPQTVCDPADATRTNCQTAACCEWRSDPFWATAPSIFEINEETCVECENVPVYWSLKAMSAMCFDTYYQYDALFGDLVLSARRVSDDMPFILQNIWSTVSRDKPRCSVEEFMEPLNPTGEISGHLAYLYAYSSLMQNPLPYYRYSCKNFFLPGQTAMCGYPEVAYFGCCKDVTFNCQDIVDAVEQNPNSSGQFFYYLPFSLRCVP
jgi:hypothetical protein